MPSVRFKLSSRRGQAPSRPRAQKAPRPYNNLVSCGNFGAITCNRSETQIAQTRMIVRTASERPVIFALGLFNWKIIDTGKTPAVESIGIVFPVLISIRTKPVSGVVVPFVSEANGNVITFECPELFDQSIIQLTCPLACKKGYDLFSAGYEFRAISPARIQRVTQTHFLRIARIPTVFSQANLLNC